MDSLAYGAPQIVFPGKVFERQFNAQSIQSAGAGICLREFNAQALEAAFEQLCSDESYRIRTRKLRERLSTLGGAARIVSEVEAYLARASLESKRAETMRPSKNVSFLIVKAEHPFIAPTYRHQAKRYPASLGCR